ncbi:MAG: hypothetical protein LBS35_08130 [Synergistaceae bacterium]|jgi:fructose-bisphosphate aldolase class 1|nr:hypothetical protein [Synergistaceae bacterium]
MFIVDIDILERGNKAVENFSPLPFGKVDKGLREATKRTGDNLKSGLKEMLKELEENYE